jgi:hypothetical protein
MLHKIQLVHSVVSLNSTFVLDQIQFDKNQSLNFKKFLPLKTLLGVFTVVAVCRSALDPHSRTVLSHYREPRAGCWVVCVVLCFCCAAK